MLEYRLYFIQQDGHIASPPVTCELASDDSALRTAIQLLNGQTIEIWQGARWVCQVEPDAKNDDTSISIQPI